MSNNSKKYFVFVDESGNNEQEGLFALGCLFIPVDKIGLYYEALNVVKSKIITKVKLKEEELGAKLKGQDLINFYKGRRREYEIKFKNINKTVAEEYTWLISQYFKFPDVKFTCLIIDKSVYSNPKFLSHYEIYINQLVMLLRNNIKDGEEIVLLADDITISGNGSNYESDIINKLHRYGKNIFGVHRVESHSNIFVQLVDVLTGAVLYEFKNGKNKYKRLVVEKIKKKLEVDSLDHNLTKRTPNYFSVWKYRRKL